MRPAIVALGGRDGEGMSKRTRGVWRTSGGSEQTVGPMNTPALAVSSQQLSGAKARLVPLRRQLHETQVAALTEALLRKPVKLADCLLEVGLGIDLLDDLRFVLEHDLWNNEPISGRQWLKEWLRDGCVWSEEVSQAATHTGSDSFCHSCCRGFSSEWALSQHAQSKDHSKKLKNWIWKHGSSPCEGGVLPEASTSPPVDTSKALVSDAGSALASGGIAADGSKGSKAKASVPEMLAKAKAAAKNKEAIAKCELLKYRDVLTTEERNLVLEKFQDMGLRRANDVANREALRGVFTEQVFDWICQVGDEEWLWKDPTLSWLAGFYWHPASAALPPGGPRHCAYYCHLCECGSFDEVGHEVHMSSRRHAESTERWVKRMGATPVQDSCARCPVRISAHEASTAGSCKLVVSAETEAEADEGPMATGANAPGDNGNGDDDIAWERPGGEADPPVPDETNPPLGFTEDHEIPIIERPGSVPYVAFVVHQASTGHRCGRTGPPSGRASLERIQVTSKHLRIGARIGKKETHGAGLYAVSLQRAPKGSVSNEGTAWRSLAMGLCTPAGWTGAKAAAAAEQTFGVILHWRWQGGRCANDFKHQSDLGEPEVEDAGLVRVVVPQAGSVAVVTVELRAQPSAPSTVKQHWGGKTWLMPSATEVTPLASFVGTMQIKAFGGLPALRGAQCAFQWATEEVMVSFLLYLPPEEEPAPLLIFFHGDLPRESAYCTMPGLAEFCDQYGPASICGGIRKSGHTARKFAIVTPSSPAAYWWFRHPAVHDAVAYVPAMERWVKGVLDWLEKLQVSRPNWVSEPGGGVRLAGQSMGGYAALEVARAMPERVAAVAVGAPCFDASRLDWLSRRICNVPLWVFIGRQDSMCAFEEMASLVLKLRDARARCVRLTSIGIGLRTHNDACKPFEKDWMYSWLLQPLGIS